MHRPPSTDVFLRRAVPADAPALTDVAMAAKAHGGYLPEILAGWRNELTVAPADLSGGLATVAERRGRALGFCALTLKPPAIADLWVHPGAMGLGVGRALVERAAERARVSGVRTLAVDADPNAADFYVRLGAVPAGSVPAPIDGQPERTRPQFALDVRTAGGIDFRPVQARDLTLLGRWLREPHVARWWPDWRRQLATMREGLTESRVHQRLVTLDGEPFAYLQHYRRHDFFEPYGVGLPAGTVALDTFIGERTALGRGLGQRYLRLAAEARVAAGAAPVTVDPDATNRAAIGAYHKAGFVGLRTLRHRPGAPVHLMAWRG